MINPLVLAHNRYSILVECLHRYAEPAARSERFAVYCLDQSGDSDRTGGEIVIVHNFARAEIDNNIGYYVANELLPLLNSTRQADFEHLVGAIVRSIDIDEQQAWQLFYDNSVAALERAISAPQSIPDFIWPFGAIYDRVLRLARGRSLLDVGTCFGFLPIIYARHARANGHAHRVVGCDLDMALVRLANHYAGQCALGEVGFTVADVLNDDIVHLGAFDTVTCIHMLEHLAAGQTMPALANLWRITRKRLILCVPLEETPDPRFGHQQVFDAERLCALGQAVGGVYRTFEHHGGWLVVDREIRD